MPGYEPFLLCDFHIHTQWSDGSLSIALELQRKGLRVVGVPKTIDNDLRSTTSTFGFSWMAPVRSIRIVASSRVPACQLLASGPTRPSQSRAAAHVARSSWLGSVVSSAGAGIAANVTSAPLLS